MGCLKLEYQPQERVLEENTLFLEKGLEKNGSGSKNRVRRYRYGFNGQERTDELKGAGNHYTAPFWEYDPRLERRWNIDPKPNPSISQYATFENSPIWFSDPYGDSVNIDINKMYEKKDGKFVNFEQAYAFEQFIQTKEGKEYILDNAQAGFTFTGQITGASLSASKSGKNSKNVNLNFTVGNTGVEKDVFGDDVYGLGLTTFDIKDGLLSMTHTVVEQSKMWDDYSIRGSTMSGLVAYDTWLHESLLHGEFIIDKFKAGMSRGQIKNKFLRQHSSSIIVKSTYWNIAIQRNQEFRNRLKMYVSDEYIYENIILPGVEKGRYKDSVWK
jgi:hypothetical protein